MQCLIHTLTDRKNNCTMTFRLLPNKHEHRYWDTTSITHALKLKKILVLIKVWKNNKYNSGNEISPQELELEQHHYDIECR